MFRNAGYLSSNEMILVTFIVYRLRGQGATGGHIRLSDIALCEIYE